jgi:hypothetical protein
MQNQTKNTIFVISVVVPAFTVALQLYPANLAFSQAVDLLPINTGNKALNGSLPVFYDCTEDAVAASENAPLQTTYFEDEPARNDMSEFVKYWLIIHQ